MDAIQSLLLNLHTNCVQVFKNGDMRKIQLDYVFTKCFTDDKRPDGADNVKGLDLAREAWVMAAVAVLKVKYSGKGANRALCHGDLHPGSGLAFIHHGCRASVFVSVTAYAILFVPICNKANVTSSDPCLY